MRQKQAPSFTPATFKRTVKSIDGQSLAGLQDRVISLLGLTGAFRRSELAALNVEALALSEEGLIANLAKSKTNQLEAAEEKAIFYSPDFKLCPVRTLQSWVQRLDRTTGPVFVSFRKGEQLPARRLTDKHLNLIVQRYLGPTYSAHSLRASFMTVVKLAGANASEVMDQTKYKTSEMICRCPRLDNIRQHNAA